MIDTVITILTICNAQQDTNWFTCKHSRYVSRVEIWPKGLEIEAEDINILNVLTENWS